MGDATIHQITEDSIKVAENQMTKIDNIIKSLDTKTGADVDAGGGISAVMRAGKDMAGAQRLVDIALAGTKGATDIAGNATKASTR